MLASVPSDEMAETLRVLAGSNAGNAARYFGRRSYDAGDIASAILWTCIARVLDRMVSAAQEPEETFAMPPVPRRMMDHQVATAFQNARFEDVDADALVREAPQETPAGVSELADSKLKVTPDFHHAEYDAAHDAQGVPQRPRMPGLISGEAPQTEAGNRATILGNSAVAEIGGRGRHDFIPSGPVGNTINGGSERGTMAGDPFGLCVSRIR